MLPGGAETVDYLGGHARGPAGPGHAEGGGPGGSGAAAFGRGRGGAEKGDRRTGRGAGGVGQAWEPAVHSAQLMFQPLRPLSGVIVLSGEFLTMTTSPTIELS